MFSLQMFPLIEVLRPLWLWLSHFIIFLFLFVAAALSSVRENALGCLCNAIPGGNFQCTRHTAFRSKCSVCGPLKITSAYFKECNQEPFKFTAMAFRKCAHNVECAKQCVSNYLFQHNIPKCVAGPEPTFTEIAKIHKVGERCALKTTGPKKYRVTAKEQKNTNSYVNRVEICGFVAGERLFMILLIIKVFTCIYVKYEWTVRRA